jgi:hypothetical protein
MILLLSRHCLYSGNQLDFNADEMLREAGEALLWTKFGGLDRLGNTLVLGLSGILGMKEPRLKAAKGWLRHPRRASQALAR